MVRDTKRAIQKKLEYKQTTVLEIRNTCKSSLLIYIYIVELAAKVLMGQVKFSH